MQLFIVGSYIITRPNLTDAMVEISIHCDFCDMMM